jgi:hypothetical protein
MVKEVVGRRLPHRHAAHAEACNVGAKAADLWIPVNKIQTSVGRINNPISGS